MWEEVYTLVSLVLVSSSPIIDPITEQPDFSLPTGFCYLPSELGQGKAVLVEDCNNLGEFIKPFFVIQYNIFPTDTFERVPKPESGSGTHAKVCCPGYSSDAIFFPGLPDKIPEYESSGLEDDNEYDYPENPEYPEYEIPEEPKVIFGSDRSSRNANVRSFVCLSDESLSRAHNLHLLALNSS